LFIDSNLVQNGEVVSTDICVVGGGVAGITFAREFMNTGREVTILESGGEVPDKYTRILAEGKSIEQSYYLLETTRERGFGGTSHAWSVDLDDQGTTGVRLKAMERIDFEKRDWIP